MSKWREVKLKSVAKVISGFAFKSSDFRNDSGIPAIKIKNIKNGDVDLTDCDYVDNKFLLLNEKYHVIQNDILVSLTGSHLTQPNSVVGRIALYRHKHTSLLNQRAGKILPDLNLVNPFYLYSYLSQDSVKESIALKARGAANQANISPGDVEDTDLMLPPIQIQSKIASILSAYDDLTENNLKRIKLLEELAQRTYEEWFVKFRVNGYQLKINTKTGLPESWFNVPLGEFIQFQKGKKVNLVVENYQQGLEKVLLLDGIESGVYPYTDPSGQVVAERGDLLMLMDGARSSKVFFADRGVVGSTMARVVIGNRLLSPTLLRNFFDYNFDLMRTNNTGAAIPHANKGFINSMLFPMPPEEVLKLWNDNVEPMYRLLETLKEQNRLLKEASDILLPRLMSGVIDVERAEEETLSIAAEPKLHYSLKK